MAFCEKFKCPIPVGINNNNNNNNLTNLKVPEYVVRTTITIVIGGSYSYMYLSACLVNFEYPLSTFLEKTLIY